MNVTVFWVEKHFKLRSRFLFCLIFQFYLMYRQIYQKPAHFLSAQKALVSTFFQMFIELGPFKETFCTCSACTGGLTSNVLYWWILMSWNQALTSKWQDAQVHRVIWKLMSEIHNGAKYVLEEHSHFFKKFLKMFQTCSASQKWNRSYTLQIHLLFVGDAA